MGIKFRTDDGQVHQVNNQTDKMEVVNGGVKHQSGMGTSGTSGTAGGSNYGTQDWHTDDAYYKQIIWNMGEEISQLKTENKELKAQIQSITKLLM